MFQTVSQHKSASHEPEKSAKGHYRDKLGSFGPCVELKMPWCSTLQAFISTVVLPLESIDPMQDAREDNHRNIALH